MKKFYKGHVYYHLLVDAIIIGLIFLSIAANAQAENVVFKPWVYVGLFLAAYVIKTVYNILYVKLSYYELKEKEIHCRRGVLFRKETILEYSKIHAINKKQNILHKFFQVAILTIDSGSTNTATTAEITIWERVDVVDKLKAEIAAYQQGKHDAFSSQPSEAQRTKSNKENLYKFTSRLKLVYSLIHTLTALLIFAVSVALVTGTIALLSQLPAFIVSKYVSLEFVLEILIFSLIFALIILLFTFFISFIDYLFKYYDFRLHRTESGLEVSYGFFSRSTNNFELSKIKAVIIRQSLLQRLFGLASINVEVVGYVESSDDNKSNGTLPGALISLCKKSQVNDFLAKIVPEFVPQAPQHKAKKYFPFVSWTLLFTLVPLIIASGACAWLLFNLGVPKEAIIIFVVCALALLFAITCLILIKGGLEYKNSGLAIGDNAVTLYGGGFTKKCVVIQKRNIISLEDVTTPMRKKSGIYSYKVHIFTNAATNVFTLKHLDAALKDNLTACVND